MTIHENTKKIKDSLVTFLDQLKLHRRITAYLQPVNRNGLEPPVYVTGLNKAINILSNLNADFESVEDFDSIKKLREAELFFLKTDGLKEFKFPDYRPKINPIYLTYVEIELQLDSLERKSDNLAFRGHSLAASEAKHMATLLRSLNHTFFKEKRMGYYDYRAQAFNTINQGRPELEQHRGYKKLLGNLVLLILTLGTAFLGNKAINGHFLFFQKTDSAKHLDTISQTVAAANQLSPIT